MAEAWLVDRHCRRSRRSGRRDLGGVRRNRRTRSAPRACPASLGGHARALLRSGPGIGDPPPGRHCPHRQHRPDRRVRALPLAARTCGGRCPRYRPAGRRHRRGPRSRRPLRAAPAGTKARTGPPSARRRTGQPRNACPPYVAVVAVAVAAEPGPRSPPLPHRPHPLAERRRDPAHDRLRHHGFRQDSAHRGPRRTDQGEGRALHRLRQDGLLHRDLLRRASRHPPQSPRQARAALVPLPRSPHRPGLRHHGGGPHPPPEGRRRSLLDHRRPPALLTRRRGSLATGRNNQPGAGGPPAQDRAQRARRGHGGHGGAVHRRSRQPEDRALGARHAHRQHRRHGPASGRGSAVLHPGVDRAGRSRVSSSSRRGATSTPVSGV